MSRILSYRVFEGKEGDKKIEYFDNILNSTPEGKDFQRWFNVKPVRTGRFYITKKTSTEDNKGIYIPSKSYFDPGYGYSDKWYYEFSSSNGSYGKTSGDLPYLMRQFMIDSILKSRPSTIQRKKIEEYLSKESNAPKGSFPTPEEVYNMVLGETGLISDFSFLGDLPISKRMEDLGIEIKSTKDSFFFNLEKNLNSVCDSILGEGIIEETLKIINSVNNSSREYPKTFKLETQNKKFEGRSGFTIVPFTDTGVKKSVSWAQVGKITYIKIGNSSEEKIKEIFEKLITEFFSGFEIWDGASGKFPELKSPFEMNYISDFIKDKIIGKDPITKKELKEKLEDSIFNYVKDHIEKKPLDIYLLDEFPDLKKRIIEELGIPDISRIGKLRSMGWI